MNHACHLAVVSGFFASTNDWLTASICFTASAVIAVIAGWEGNDAKGI